MKNHMEHYVENEAGMNRDHRGVASALNSLRYVGLQGFQTFGSNFGGFEMRVAIAWVPSY